MFHKAITREMRKAKSASPMAIRRVGTSLARPERSQQLQDRGQAPAATATPDKAHTSLDVRPIVYVTHYCGIEPSPLGAAVRDGLARLAAFAAQNEEVTYDTPLVKLRNRRVRTVTIDIGLPLDRLPSLPVAGGLRLGRSWGIDLPSLSLGSNSLGEALAARCQSIAQMSPEDFAGSSMAWQL
jgi:hypothetical protein